MNGYLVVVMTTGEEMIVTSVGGNRFDPARDIMLSKGWVFVEPERVWLNTAQIVSIKEVRQ